MEVANLVAKFSAEGEQSVMRALGNVDRGITNVADNSVRAGRGLGTVFQVAGGFLGAQLVNFGFNAAKGLVDMQANAEQARISLEVVTGSAERANELFAELQGFAAETPFAFPELMDSAIALEAFGLKAEDWLTTIGDTASAMGKSVDQVTQAVLDATTGEYERLKELGIKARVEGDKLVFSYMKNGQEITQTVDKNNREVIASTVQSIWNEKYAGAMEKQSKTFAGQMSTLKDNIALTMQNATASVFQFATRGLAFVNDVFANGFVATIEDRFGPGAAAFVGHIGTMAQGVIDAFGEGAPVAEIVNRLPESWRPVGDAVFRAADAFGQLVTNISQGDWSGVVNDLEQLGNAAVRLAGALGQKIIPAIQQFFDTNRFSGFTAAIRIDAFQPVVDAMARGDIEAAIESLWEADPIQVTPEIQLNIRQAVQNWVAGFGISGGAGGGGGDDFGIGDAIESAFSSAGIAGRLTQWATEKVAPDLGRAGVAIVEGVIAGVEQRTGLIDFTATLSVAGSQLVTGLQTGAAEVWISVDEWFNSRDEAAVSAIGDLSTTLETAGTQLIEGLETAAGDAWAFVADWLGGLGEEAASWVGDLSGYLVTAGASLIQGLVNGISSRLPDLRGVVGEAIGIIDSIIGVIDPGSPSRTFLPVGESVTWALAEGMQARMRDLRNVVGDVNSAIGFAGNAPKLGMPAGRGLAAAGAGTVVIDNRGAYIGRGAEAELRRLIESTGANLIDRRVNANALAGARR